MKDSTRRMIERFWKTAPPEIRYLCERMDRMILIAARLHERRIRNHKRNFGP